MLSRGVRLEALMRQRENRGLGGMQDVLEECLRLDLAKRGMVDWKHVADVGRLMVDRHYH